jgi:hypothetical protein
MKKPDPKEPALDCPLKGLNGLSPLRQSAGVMEHCRILNHRKLQVLSLRVSGVPPEADQVSGKRNIEAET